MASIAIDLVGKKFGRLVVVSRGSTAKNGEAMWNCRCDCGGTKIVRSHSLRTRTKSCGCIKSESCYNWLTVNGHPRTRHRHAKLGRSPTYVSWQSMKVRCENSHNRAYKWYGAKGVVVCARWSASFEAFLADVGLRPGLEYCLARNGDAGNYEPGNASWTLKKENARESANRRWGNSA